jgi:hypothetical protein
VRAGRAQLDLLDDERLDPRGAFTSGLYRNIDIVLPEGTVISALPPDGAVFATTSRAR